MARSRGLALVGCFVAFLAGAAEPPAPSAPTASGLLYDNGPFVNSPGTGAGGADESVIQLSIGLSIVGFHHTAGSHAIADDFTVPGPSGWWVDSATTFGSQFGDPEDNFYTAVSMQVWDGPPGQVGSRIVFNTVSDDDLRYTTWTGAYRVGNTGDTDLPINANTVRLGVLLTPGTYWLVWAVEAEGDSGEAPPITITGQADTGNALQFSFSTGLWTPVEDAGHPQGFPFVLRGRQVSCRAPGAPVPDDDPAGVTDSLPIGAGAGLIDVNLHVAATHPSVDDLVVRLEREESGTTVTTLDRPDCNEEGLRVTFDDEASDSVVGYCFPGVPAIQGRLTPQSPLMPFDGQSSVGTWSLTVSDEENGGTGTLDAWCLDLVVPTFADVSAGTLGAEHIEALSGAEVTGGCGTAPLIYCPNGFVTRAQMAVFLLKGRKGPYFRPGTATGAVFDDVGAGDFAAVWIERLFADGVTSGCQAVPPLYCPGSNVTRAQMAVFLLKSKFGSSYVPPPATGLVFQDVGAGDFAAAWIEALAAEGITGGCSAAPPLYCPGASVTRAQMAIFLVRAFGLPLP